MQEGAIGFYEGVRKYDPAKGTKVITVGVLWARKYIDQYIERYKYSVKLPRNEYRDKVKLTFEEFEENNFDAAEVPYFEDDRNYELVAYIMKRIGESFSIIPTKSGGRPLKYLHFIRFVQKINQKMGFCEDLRNGRYCTMSKKTMTFWQNGQFEYGQYSIPSRLVFDWIKNRYSLIITKESDQYLIKHG